MSKQAATDKAQTFLEGFESALKQGSSATAALFADDCYWRDLVSFTWNIKTVEGREQIKDMLDAQLASIQPSNFRRYDRK